MTDMMDFYDVEQAKIAVQEAEETKIMLQAEIDKLNTLILILKYYLATGDKLKQEGFEIDWEGNDG